MKKLTTLTFALLLGSIAFTQTNISTNDMVDALTTTCSSATHVSIYYPKSQKHFSDSIALSNITAEALYLDAKAKGSVINGYLNVEIAFMENNNFVCQVRKYKIITPDFFELTKKNYCVNEEANFAKNRVNYDGMETIYVLDSNKNYIDTGALYTPTAAGKYFIEYNNASVGLVYLDSITVNPQPTISFTTPIPDLIQRRKELIFYLDSHITHNGVKLESNSPGIIKYGTQLALNTLYIGKYHNIMNYTSVSSKGCKNTLIDTVFMRDSLGGNSRVPILNFDPSQVISSSIPVLTAFTHGNCPIPMSIKKHYCDGSNITLTNSNAFNYDTNYVFLWYQLTDNVLTKLSNTSSSLTYKIPDNNKNDLINILFAAIEKATLDTTLFFNELIQTYAKPKRNLICSDLGDSTKINISSVSLSHDLNNTYWSSGTFNKLNYSSVNSFNYTAQAGGYKAQQDYIINDNTQKRNVYNTYSQYQVPAKSNIVEVDFYTNTSGSITLNKHTVNFAGTCGIYDTLVQIIKPDIDVNFTTTLNSSGLIPSGGAINHTVNNTSLSSNYSINYFTDTISGSTGSYVSNKPGYIHAGYLITDKYGCSSDSTFYNLFQMAMPVGISELTNSEVNVFPNPFTNQITIETENIENANVRIYNIYGGLVYQNTRNINGRKVFDIPTNLPKGTYVLRVIGEKKGFTQKLTKI